jgi:hypothetical protein
VRLLKRAGKRFKFAKFAKMHSAGLANFSANLIWLFRPVSRATSAELAKMNPDYA